MKLFELQEDLILSESCGKIEQKVGKHFVYSHDLNLEKLIVFWYDCKITKTVVYIAFKLPVPCTIVSPRVTYVLHERLERCKAMNGMTTTRHPE